MSKYVFEPRNSTRNKAISLRIFNTLWRYKICLAKFLFSYRDDLPENLGKSIAKEFNNTLSGWPVSLKNVFVA